MRGTRWLLDALTQVQALFYASIVSKRLTLISKSQIYRQIHQRGIPLSVALRFLNQPTSLPPLSLVVHSDPDRLDREVSSPRDVRPEHLLSVSRILAEALSEVPSERWPVTVRESLEKAIGATQAEVVICADLALLFEPDLDVNPLALLRRCAYRTKVVALWPGSYRDGILVFGTPDHAHYRTWSHPDVHVIPLR